MGTDSNSIADGVDIPQRGIGAALRRVHPVWWLNLAIWAAAIALFVGPVAGLPPLHEPHVAWWWLALGFLVGERCVVHLEFSRNAHSFSLGDVPLVFGLVLATGGDLVIAAVVGPALTLLLDRRLPPIKLFFNLGQFALSVCLATIICYWLAPVGTDWGPQLAIAVLVGAQVSAIICVALIGAAISLSEGWLGLRQLTRMFATDLTVTVTNSSLGLVAALIVSTEPWALPLLVVPLLTVFLAYRAYVSERKRGERLEFLYEANRTLSRSPEIAEALEGLLARSLDAFRAERAEIILWTPDKPPLRTTLGPGDHKEVMAEVDPEVAIDLQSLVSNDHPVVTLPDAARGSAVAEYMQERGVHKAMLAMLPGEDRVIGTLMLSNRYGVVRDFSADDQKLFETLANNASVALQYDRLEQAIARLKDLQQQLRHQAFHDSLTDLPNRALFISSVREALDKAPQELAVLFIDVDDFKTVNDTLGHAIGDELLVAVADRLRSCVRPQDEIARLGGDEFAVRLNDAVDAEGAAESVAKRIMEAFQLPIEAGGELLSIRLSVGIASAHQGASDEDELIRHADMAMYQAKMAGKACFERFDPEAQAMMLHRRQMKDDLRRAVENGELTVHYQPIVALATGHAAAAEALVRWEHPERGPDHARRVHPARRGDRHDRRDRPLRAARGLHAGEALAGRRGRRRAGDHARRAREPQRARAPPDRPHRHRQRRDRGGRHPAVGPRARDHREPAARGRRAQRRRAARAARARRAPRARRLRHRLLVAELPALAAAGHPQDRQAVRGPRGGGVARLLRADDDRPGEGARARGDRRGHRDRRAGGGAARAAVLLRPGLLPRPARGRHGLAGRRTGFLTRTSVQALSSRSRERRYRH